MEFLIVLRYLLVFALLAVLGAPIAALIFRELPHRGAAFALPTALIPLAIVVFWVGQLTFGVHTVLLGVGVVAVGSLLARRRAAPDWRAVATTYGVFTVGFLLLVLFRSANPGITPAGGEQFLHFGLVNALERADSLPPEDMWYAGESLRYYYGTQLQVTSFSLLTGTPVRYGFNLGIAAFYGVLVVVGYGLAGAIVARRGHSFRLGGSLGAVFVGLGGPTTTPIRLVTPYLPERVADLVAPAAFGFVAQRFNGGDLTQAVADLSAPLDWSWWYTRYVVPGTIQEVPLYSFVKADLHGHSLSTGFVLFAGAVAYAYYLTPSEQRLRRASLLFGGLGAIAGVFGFMNTWALPTAGGLALLAAGAANAHPATMLPEPVGSRLQIGSVEASDRSRAGRLQQVGQELWRLVLAALAAGVVVLLGVLVASPFLIFGDVPSNNGIGLFPPRSPLGPFLVIYAGVLGLFALYVTTQGWDALRGVDRGHLLGGGVGLALAVLVTVSGLQFGVLAVTGPLLAGAWYLVRSGRGDFGMVLLVAGVGLLLSFELVHARLPEIANPRWNTALKVAVQGWTLAGAGAAVGAAVVLARGRERLSTYRSAEAATTDGGDEQRVADANEEQRVADAMSRRPPIGAAVSVVIVVIVLVATLVFPTMVFGQEVGAEVAEDEFEPTVNGHSNLERFHSGEAAAIDWLNDRRGTPTIVEAPGPSYDYTSTASTFTGLPTVIGWDHQEEYRSPEAYDRRVAHVDAIYAGDWATASRHLQRYDVAYVYVGPGERERYGSGLRSFERSAFSVVFDNEAVTVYEVDETKLEA